MRICLFIILFIFCSFQFKVNAMQVTHGELHVIEDFPSENVAPRPVRIWLPNGYSKTSEYAVVFMHDGQMLFDKDVTWNGQAWEVDEVAQSLIDAKKVTPFIVVGIDNIAERRHAEYFPQAPFLAMTASQQTAAYALERAPDHLLFGGHKVQSDNYLKFIIEELRPFIEQNYAVTKDHKKHFIMGSSMGGLISWYMANEYPDAYGGAGCLSTHWLGAFDSEDTTMFDQFYAYLDETLPIPQRFLLYFDHGDQTLDQYYPEYQAKINELLESKNYQGPKTKVLSFPGTDHSENAWRDRLHIPFTFFLGTESAE